MVALCTLKYGDTYGNGKYRILDNDGEKIKIRRLSDQHYIVFHIGTVNWNWQVKKD